MSEGRVIALNREQSFWNDIFAAKGARYSDGMISGTFGCGESMVKPCVDSLLSMMPRIEKLFYKVS